MARFFPGRLAAFLLSSALTLAGCGVGRYDERMAESREALLATTPARRLLLTQPTHVDETGWSFQAPKLFGSDRARLLAPEEKSPQGFSYGPRQLMPPGIRLPGFRFCYEAEISEGRWRAPLYCYVAAPGEVDQPEDLLDQMKERWPEAFKEQNPPQWAPGAIDGSQTISVRATMQFDDPNGGTYDKDGRLDWYWFEKESAETKLLVGFRGPVEVAEPLELFAAGKLAMETVTWEKPPETKEDRPEDEAAAGR